MSVSILAYLVCQFFWPETFCELSKSPVHFLIRDNQSSLNTQSLATVLFNNTHVKEFHNPPPHVLPIYFVLLLVSYCYVFSEFLYKFKNANLDEVSQAQSSLTSHDFWIDLPPSYQKLKDTECSKL